MPIDCPYCGNRPIEEFSMLGDATKQRPTWGDPAEMDDRLAAQWHDYVYLRDNPKGWIEEYWHHAGGCRSWLPSIGEFRLWEDQTVAGPARWSAS